MNASMRVCIHACTHAYTSTYYSKLYKNFIALAYQTPLQNQYIIKYVRSNSLYLCIL